jgi:hypothetical protein
MWLVFFCAVPQLHTTYELRLRYGDFGAWDCLVFVEGKMTASFSGDAETTANALWSRVFSAIGATDAAVPTAD